MSKNNLKHLISFVLIVFSSGIKFGSAIGVSLFDFVASILLIKLFLSKKLVFKRNELKYFIPIIIIQFVPFIFNEINGTRLLYSLRFLEYFVVGFYIYIYMSKTIFEEIYIKIFTLIGLFFLFSYFINSSLTPFTYIWESATFFSLVSVMMITKPKKTFFDKILLVFFISIVIICDQRTPIIATFICISFFFIKELNIIKIISISILALFILTTFVNSESSRLFLFISNFSFEDLKLTYGLIQDQSNYYDSYADFVYSNRSLLVEGGDLSLQLRLKKWVFALSQLNIVKVVFGLGPGYFGGAADSSLIRIFFETGLIGLFFWTRLILFLKKETDFILFLCIIINSLMIDTFYSSKITFITVLLFFLFKNRYNTSFHKATG